MSEHATIIEVIDLHKHYPNVKAVDGISFKIPQGICFGLLGPNGAGKTTTIEVMEGITPPTRGEVRYKGKPLGQQFRNEAGIQFQSTALQEFLTVREQIKLFQSFYPHGLAFDDLVDVCSLGDYLDQDASKLSGGQRQRLLLAIALVNDPEVVFLDEPTTGLDPQARLNFWNLVNRIKSRNKTVLLTTHYMDEAYNLCDDIVIVDHGKIIAHGSPDSLLDEHFQDVVIELPYEDFPESAHGLPHNVLDKVTRTVEIVSKDVNETLAYLIKHNASLTGLQVRPRTLEDLFIALTGKDIRS